MIIIMIGGNNKNFLSYAVLFNIETKPIYVHPTKIVGHPIS